MTTFDSPVRQFDKLWHLGTLQLEDKDDYSFEGNCLSVSRDPEEWRQVARLGGLPLWEVDATNLSFVDAHAFRKLYHKDFLAFSIQNKWLRECILWKSVTFNEDDEEEFMFSFSKEEALLEVDHDEKFVAKENSFTVTDNIALKHGWEQVTLPSLSFDLALIEYAAYTDFHGVWWEDIFAPQSLSLPRGGILPSHVERLTWHQLPTGNSYT